MIKNFIKRTGIWKKFSNSDLYQSIRFPSEFKKRQIEPNFYKKFLESHPCNNTLIFDVGANKGYKAEIFSKLANKVVAFEPSEKLFDSLQRRFENSKNIILFNYALGSRVFQSQMYVVENNEAYNSLNEKHIETTTASRGIATLDSVSIQKVKVEVLENFIKKFGVPKYVKIDVEGYELEVIEGLHTAVPLVSFEANLPEFCDEAIQSIKLLDNLSPENYTFNFVNCMSFLKEDFMDKNAAIDYLKNTRENYLEIYAKLKK